MTVKKQESAPLAGAGRIPFDPRMLQKMGRRQWAEQGAQPLQRWGGPAGYKQMAALTPPERMVYAAVLEGYSSEDDISVATGLGKGDVQKGVSGLQVRGMVEKEAAELGEER